MPPAEIVGTAEWDGRRVEINAPDDVRPVLLRIFRPTPVVVDEPARRPRGATGEVVIQPGSLEWFLAAATIRGAIEGFEVRLVPSAMAPGGWDPAAAYQPFVEVIRHREMTPSATAAAASSARASSGQLT